MKGLFLLLTVVSVATAYVTYPSPATIAGIDCPIHAGCPAIDNPEFTVHLADKTDCHKYYKCVSGRGCLQECPRYNEAQSRLVFNPKLEVCDWPTNVPEIHCSDKSSTAPSVPTEATPTTKPAEATPTTKPTEATPTTKPTEATPTTKPTEATPTTKPTEATPTTKPTEATPTTKPTEATPAAKPTEAAPTTEATETTPGTSPTRPTEVPTEPGECPKHGDLLIAHKTDCRAYYSCHNGFRSGVQYCLEGNIFNPIQHTCDIRSNETIKYCPNGSVSN